MTSENKMIELDQQIQTFSEFINENIVSLNDFSKTDMADSYSDIDYYYQNNIVSELHQDPNNFLKVTELYNWLHAIAELSMGIYFNIASVLNSFPTNREHFANLQKIFTSCFDKSANIQNWMRDNFSKDQTTINDDLLPKKN